MHVCIVCILCIVCLLHSASRVVWQVDFTLFVRVYQKEARLQRVLIWFAKRPSLCSLFPLSHQILACDGLWDVMQPEQMVGLMGAYRTDNKGESKGAAKVFVDTYATCP